MITCWEGGLLGVLDDLLAMSALMRGRMEKVAETGSNFLTAGRYWLNLYLTMPWSCNIIDFSGKEVVSDVSASVKASKEKVTGAFNR